MVVVVKCLKILYLIFRYRVFFLIGFIPYFGIFKIFFNSNSKKQALRFKDFLEHTGPCFVKLGQIFSVRNDLIGKTFAEALSTLREDGKKSNYKFIKSYIKDAFGGNNLDINEFINQDSSCVTPLNNSRVDIFDDNNLKLIAIGSVSEVYKLTLNNTYSLAIKVLKPTIRKQFREDITFLRKIFSFAQKNIRHANRTKILKIVDLLEKISIFELDLKFEAAAAAEVKENFRDLDILYVPKIYWKYCTKNVLVTEWIEGCKIYNVSCLESRYINTKSVLIDLIKVFFFQVFKFGFFHGDMHPGNLIVKNDGKIAMVDFGIMGRVTLANRKYIYDVWKAFLNQDYKAAAKVHFKAGWVADSYNVDDLALAIRSIVDPIFMLNEKTFSVGKLMEQLFEVTRLFGMEIQRDLLLIQKDMLLLEGMTRILAPDIHIWRLSKNIINQKEFDIAIEDKIEYTKSYVNSKINNTLYKIAETFAIANNDVKQKYYQNNNLEKNYRLPKLYRFIIILLLLTIIILLWKI